MIQYIISAFSIIVLAIVFCCFFISKRGTKGSNGYSILYFTVIFAVGTILHIMGLLHAGKETFLLALIHGCISSFKMFAINFDSAAIASLASVNSVYMWSISLCYFTAVVGTFYVLVTTLGKNIISNIRIFINKNKEKCIIVGDSEAGRIFVKSLEKECRVHTIIVLDKKDIERKRELIKKGFCVIQSTLNENSLRRIGAFCKKNPTAIIAMFDKDAENLNIAKIITDYYAKQLNADKAKDNLTKDQLKILSEIKITANIMYNNIEKTEHFSFVEKAYGRVKFFNVYEMRARKFVIDNPITKLIPSEWINTEKARLYKKWEDNTSSTNHLSTENSYKISNIFVGFGDTNKQLLKKSICNGQMLGCNYRAVIFDKNIEESKLQFFNNSSGLIKENLQHSEGSIYFDAPNENYDIIFEEDNTLSIDFYKKIVKEVQKNDFSVIYIALGDDRLSVETALEIRQKLSEYKNKDNVLLYNKKQVRIFVKIKETTMLANEDILKSNDETIEPIIAYGTHEEVLTAEYILGNRLDKAAIKLANSYSNFDKMNKVEQADYIICNDWDRTSNFKRDSNRYSAMSIPIKLNLLGLDLDNNDNIVDFVTGQKVSTEEYFVKYDAHGYCKFNPFYEEKPSFYETDDKNFVVDTARNNLARLEHLRWDTFHLVSGWTKLPKSDVEDYAINKRTKGRQNEITKQHACITTFEGLIELRDMQAKKHLAAAKNIAEDSLESARQKADTISYDFDLMDKIIER